MRKIVAITFITLATSAGMLAHVELRPQVSTVGADQQYTVRAHNEVKTAVTSIMLDVPAEVTVTEVAKPTVGSYDVKREGNRITVITWTQEIKPATFADFRFTAKNPAKGTQIVWHVREHMADGTTTEWGGAAGGAHPGPITRLNAAGAKAPTAPADHAADHDRQH